MKNKKIRLYDLKLSAAAMREVREVLKSGWLTTGPKTERLEKEIASLTGCRYAVAVSSATAGLQLALEVLGARSGSQVITSPFTFVATVEAILRTGATPVLADIDPDSLNIDPDEVARMIGRKTIALMPVDIGGYPCDYAKLTALSDARKLPTLSDASHSLGATWRRRSMGRLVDCAVYSFQATKNVAAGEGGMVVSRHKELAEKIRLLSRHALTSNAYQRRKQEKWEYDVLDLGMKANLPDLQAAVALGQLSVFERSQKIRTRLADRYSSTLKDLTDYLEIPHVAAGFGHAWHLYIIRLHLSRLKIDRNRFIRLMANAGIECGVHYKPLFELSYYNHLGYSAQHFPNASYAGQRVVSLPMHTFLKLSDIDRVCDTIADIVARFGR